MSDKFALSPRTKAIIDNFRNFHPSITLEAGNLLRIADEGGLTLAYADIEETIPMTFPIFETSNLISVLKLQAFKDAEIEFVDNNEETEVVKHMVITGKAKTKFFSDSANMVELPDSEPDISSEVTFQASIQPEQLNDFDKACSALSLDTCRFIARDGKVYMSAVNSDTDNSNDYTIEIGTCEKDLDVTTDIKTDWMKLIAGNYNIYVVEDYLVKFEAADGALRYYIGAEQY